MFEREQRMYGLFRRLQQDDLLTGDIACHYTIAVALSDTYYYQNTGGIIMQSLLYEQGWVFSVDTRPRCGKHSVSIRAMRGRTVTVLRDIKGPAVKA